MQEKEGNGTKSLLEEKGKTILRWAILTAVSLLAVLFFSILGYGAWLLSYEILTKHKDEVVELYLNTVFEHFGATVGLPLTAISALGLVLLLGFSAGPIEFEGLGFKFKGASGSIIFWVLSYLVLAGTIKLLW